MSGLGQSGVAAVKWSTVATVFRFSLQLIAQVVLARVLGPEIFGVFGIGILVLTFSAFISGFGFSWSLLQRTTIHEEDVRFAFTWQVIVGIAAMLGLYFLAPWIAGYFREPRAEAVIEWLSLSCLLSAAAAPASYLLQRDLNFRAVGLVQVGSYAAGYLAVGMPMALLGYGVSSLVAASLVQAAVLLVASYALKPHSLKVLFWYPGAVSAVGTGRAVFLTNVVNWMLNNLDRVLIGRLLNAQALGLYSVAYNLATVPNTVLLGALQPAFLAAGARLQDEPQRLGRVYLQMLATVLVLTVPAFVFLAVISSDLVRLLYGTQWSQAAWVLAVLFLSMPAYVAWGISTPVLWNTGRKHQEFALQLPLLGAGLAGFYMYAGQGIRAAAVVAALLLLARALVIGAAALRALNLRWTALAPHAARGIFISAVCAFGAMAGQHAVARVGLPLLSLVAAGLGSLGFFILVVAVRPQVLGDQASGMVVRFFPRLAGFLRSTAVAANNLDGQRP